MVERNPAQMGGTFQIRQSCARQTILSHEIEDQATVIYKKVNIANKLTTAVIQDKKKACNKPKRKTSVKKYPSTGLCVIYLPASISIQALPKFHEARLKVISAFSKRKYNNGIIL